MEFRILGPTEVLDGGRRVPLPSGRGRALLALLVLHAGEPVSADRLIDELWGEGPPQTARTVVHGLVSRLRHVGPTKSFEAFRDEIGPGVEGAHLPVCGFFAEVLPAATSSVPGCGGPRRAPVLGRALANR
jgi:hypothetical protein